MGMFGNRNFADVLSILGAGLKDASPGSEGGNLLAIQKMQVGRQEQAAKDAFTQQIAQLLAGTPGRPAAPTMKGPGMDGAPIGPAQGPGTPGTPGLNINDPRMALIEFMAGQNGVKLPMDTLKAQQPDVRFDRGFGYNGKTGEGVGGFHPDLGEGRGLGPNGGVATLPGYAQSVGEVEGAKTGAQEQAKAKLDVISINMPDGSTQQVPRDLAVQAILQSMTGGGQGGAGGATGFGRSQTPAAASASKIVGDAQAGALVTLPQTLQSANQAIGLIDKMMSHPSLSARTGLSGMLPAFPGTGDAGFDAMSDQLKGKVFLEAFSSLKGAGQITEVEGAKATDAIARLNRHQSDDDYKSALVDLRGVIANGVARAKGQAGAGSAAPTRGPTMTGRNGSRITAVHP